MTRKSSATPPALAALLLWFLPPGAADDAKVTVELQEARPFGYVIGDLIRRQATVTAPGGFRLEREHLPAPAPLNPWLDLRAVEVEEKREQNRTRYDIAVTFQVFKGVKDSEKLTLPPIPLRFHDGAGVLEAEIPAWTFGYGPLIPRLAPDEEVEIRPSREAEPLLIAPRLWRLGMVAGAAALVLAYLAWVYDLIPLIHRRPGPFTRACREIGSLRKRGGNADNERRALQLFHTALNQTAGETLFAPRLDAFFQSHPRYAGLTAPTARFFARSRQLFFGDPADAGSDFTLAELERLCKQFRRIERSRAGRSGR